MAIFDRIIPDYGSWAPRTRRQDLAGETTSIGASITGGAVPTPERRI